MNVPKKLNMQAVKHTGKLAVQHSLTSNTTGCYKKGFVLTGY